MKTYPENHPLSVLRKTTARLIAEGQKPIEGIPVKGYAIKTPKGYFATQGNMQWCQETPDGWALYGCEAHARAVMEYASHVEGTIETITSCNA